MVIVWIGLGVGILLAIILIKKIMKTSPRDSFNLGLYCKRCGYKTNSLKCPRCEHTSSRQNWK